MPELALHEASLILRGWQDERRLIHFHVGESGDPALLAFGVGTIEELTPDFLRIDSRSAEPPETGRGRMHGCAVLAEASRLVTEPSP